MASQNEVSETPLTTYWMAEAVDKLTQRFEDALRIIRDLNESKRRQDEEIQSLRERIDMLNEDAGFDYNGTRVIPRAAAAKLLHKTPRTLLRWEKDELLEPIVLRTQVYYRREQVERLLRGSPS